MRTRFAHLDVIALQEVFAPELREDLVADFGEAYSHMRSAGEGAGIGMDQLRQLAGESASGPAGPDPAAAARERQSDKKKPRDEEETPFVPEKALRKSFVVERRLLDGRAIFSNEQGSLDRPEEKIALLDHCEENLQGHSLCSRRRFCPPRRGGSGPLCRRCPTRKPHNPALLQKSKTFPVAAGPADGSRPAAAGMNVGGDRRPAAEQKSSPLLRSLSGLVQRNFGWNDGLVLLSRFPLRHKLVVAVTDNNGAETMVLRSILCAWVDTSSWGHGFCVFNMHAHYGCSLGWDETRLANLKQLREVVDLY